MGRVPRTNRRHVCVGMRAASRQRTRNSQSIGGTQVQNAGSFFKANDAKGGCSLWRRRIRLPKLRWNCKGSEVGSKESYSGLEKDKKKEKKNGHLRSHDATKQSQGGHLGVRFGRRQAAVPDKMAAPLEIKTHGGGENSPPLFIGVRQEVASPTPCPCTFGSMKCPQKRKTERKKGKKKKSDSRVADSVG